MNKVYRDRAFILVPAMKPDCPITFVDRLIHASQENCETLGFTLQTVEESKACLGTLEPDQWIRQYDGKTHWSYAYYLPSDVNPFTPYQLAVWSVVWALSTERKGKRVLLGTCAKGLGELLGMYRETVAEHLKTLEDVGFIKLFPGKYHTTLMSIGVVTDPPADWFIALAPADAFEGLSEFLDSDVEKASDTAPTWKDVAPGAEEGSPYETMITTMIKSGMKLEKVKDYYGKHRTQAYTLPNGCQVDLLPFDVINGLIAEARSEHRRNNGNDLFGTLLDYKLAKFLTEKRQG